MSKRSLDNLLGVLRKTDIKSLESLEMFKPKQLQHFLNTIDAPELATSDAGLRVAQDLIQSYKANKIEPQILAEKQDSSKNLLTIKDRTKNKMGKNISIENNFRSPDASAIFDINVTRLTHAINSTLYVPIFGALDRESSYVDVLSGLNPAGVTWLVEDMTNKKGLKFTFTDGVGTDIINVECGQVAYKNLLRACQGSILTMEQNKMNISDATAQTEFAASFWFITNSLFGKLTKDSFTPNQFKTDLQNQNDIRVITANWEVDQETTFVVPMVDGFTALQLSITSFLSKYTTSRS